MSQPPKWAVGFLRWYCREDYLEEIEGDLKELYKLRSTTSPKAANARFAWDVLRSFRPSNLKPFKVTNSTMIQLISYARIYFRRFKKEVSHYTVNISGLALGFMVFLFTLIYVHDEQNIDRYHLKADRIYRVIERGESENGIVCFSSTANPMGAALKAEFPEIEEQVSLIYSGSSGLKRGDIHFVERNYAITSPDIFRVLDFKMVGGDPLRKFSGEMAVVLSQSTAKRLFGEENPVGQVIEIPEVSTTVEVLAVMEDMPKNSTYQFSAIYLANYHLWGDDWNRWLTSWNRRGMTTLVLLKKGASPESILAGKQAFMEKYMDEDLRRKHDFDFQSISDIHLGSTHMESGSMEPLMTVAYSKRDFVTIILLIGSFVLLLASLNYVNLSSVQALKRSKEAGIRKVNGATSGQLRTQLFIESFLTLLLAYTFSIGLVLIGHNWMLEISQKSIPFSRFFESDLIKIQALVFMSIWLLSTLIPALYYSKLTRAALVIKNAFTGKGDLLRKSFITIQYSISLILIIGSMVIYRQLNYIQTKDLGFDKEQMITLDINSGEARRNFKSIVAALKENPNVINSTTSSSVPGEWKSIGTAKISEIQGEEGLPMYHYAIDHHWLDTYEIKLKDGQNFSGSDFSDSLKVILNETAARQLGLDQPIGKSIWVSSDTLSKMEVIGVVSDFHFESLHKTMQPVFLTSWNNPVGQIDYFSIKYRGGLSEVITHIEQVQRKFDPLTPPEINFLDQKWERYYQADQSRSHLILIATIISIIISSFGLFGLVNFTAERKTKEIGIRKVMGASIPGILKLILRDYVFLLLVAFLISGPVAYWFLSDWLDGFAYRIDLHPGFLLVAFGLIAFISFLTVIFKVRKLASANPIGALRYE